MKNKPKPIRVKGISVKKSPVFVFENGLEVVVDEGSEKLISKIVVNGRVFVPKT